MIKNRIFSLPIWLCVWLLISEVRGVYAQPKQLAIAVLAANKQQLKPFSVQFDLFDQSQPDIEVRLDFYSDLTLKSKLQGWMETGEYDLIHWQAGKRLNYLVDQELIQPIDTLLPREVLVDSISPIALEAVFIDGAYQGLPFIHYPWGFYYNKRIFSRLSLSPPKTWLEFITLCETLRKNGVSPLVQANKNKWPLLAWVNYLALDNGGLDTHQAIVEYSGAKRSKIEAITEQFSELLRNGYFYTPDHNWNIEDSLSVVLRQQAAMTLMGQFVESGIPESGADELGYFAFPYKSLTEERYSVTPVDAFIVPQSSQNLKIVPRILAFLMKPEISTNLATQLGFLPTGRDMANRELGERTAEGLKQVIASKRLVQFFDRDADQVYAMNIANGLARSIAVGQAHAFKSALLGEEFIPPNNQSIYLNSPTKLLNFSSLTGSKGTFFASNVMRAVYKKLGYDISVTRFPDLEAAIQSHNFGADGELVRVKAFGERVPALIRVPEPLTKASIFLVCNKGVDCEKNIPVGSEVAVSSDMLIVDKWLKGKQVSKRVYPSLSAMLDAYEKGDIPFIILTSVDAYAYSDKLSNSSYRGILTIPFYHFIHKKHKRHLGAINDELIKFKGTDEFNVMKSRYWLAH